MKLVLKKHHQRKLELVKELILLDLKAHYSITHLSKTFGINTYLLKNGFKLLYGTGPYEFLQANRLKRAEELLKTDLSIKEIALECGYNHHTNMTAAFKRNYSVLPSHYRRQFTDQNNTASNMKDEYIFKLVLIRNRILEDIQQHHTIPSLAATFGINDFQLKTGFKELYGLGPYDFLQTERIKLAVQLLVTTNIPIRDIAAQCGYKFATNMIAAFRRYFNSTPNQIRKEKKNISITWPASARAGKVVKLPSKSA